MALGGRKSQNRAPCGMEWEDGGIEEEFIATKAQRHEEKEHKDNRSMLLVPCPPSLVFMRGTAAPYLYCFVPRATFL